LNQGFGTGVKKAGLTRLELVRLYKIYNDFYLLPIGIVVSKYGFTINNGVVNNKNSEYRPFEQSKLIVNYPFSIINYSSPSPLLTPAGRSFGES
jgi:hypothetical protein